MASLFITCRLQPALVAIALLAVIAGGCSSWPLAGKERTSSTTPAMRIAAIRETGARAKKMEAAEQQKICEELALQIRTEQDPLVRQAIQQAMGNFSTPLAKQVLLAGLNDEALEVQLTCCRKLAERADPTTVSALRDVVESSPRLDVRLEAVDALSQIKTSDSMAAIALALEDRDPAMQLAGVNAMKSITGKNLGNDVTAWREYAKSGEMPEQPEISLAERVKQLSPF